MIANVKTDCKIDEFANQGERYLVSPRFSRVLEKIAGSTNISTGAALLAQRLVSKVGRGRNALLEECLKEVRIDSVKESELLSSDARLIPGRGRFSVLLNAKLSKTRKRFTLAHEIGHTFFYVKKTDTLARIVHPEDREHEELFCDCFASNLLMPEHEVRAYFASKDFNVLCIHDFLWSFRVSKDAAFVRLRAIGILDEYKVMLLICRVGDGNVKGHSGLVAKVFAPKAYNVYFPNWIDLEDILMSRDEKGIDHYVIYRNAGLLYGKGGKCERMKITRGGAESWIYVQHLDRRWSG